MHTLTRRAALGRGARARAAGFETANIVAMLDVLRRQTLDARTG